jgi:ADP-L-glycero-D-manno-heptose 6-epimerase
VNEEQFVMHIVTGAAGFIGSNLIRGLNACGIDAILAVDNLANGSKFRNLRDCLIADYMDRDEFRELVRRGASSLKASAILHQGACADTMESDGRLMMDANFTFSKELLHWAIECRIPFVYASSAAVYGQSTCCIESPEFEAPVNLYAYSKLQFDLYVRRALPRIETTVVGLRYFNVYGPGEAHKGRMASMIHQLYHQLRRTGVAQLFQGTDGFADGEQRRDFVAVEDVVEVNLFFARREAKRGIFNVGTGQSRSFNDLAQLLIENLKIGEIRYIPFPDSLVGHYQNVTQAELTALRGAGYSKRFASLEEGIGRFCELASG